MIKLTQAHVAPLTQGSALGAEELGTAPSEKDRSRRMPAPKIFQPGFTTINQVAATSGTVLKSPQASHARESRL